MQQDRSVALCGRYLSLDLSIGGLHVYQLLAKHTVMLKYWISEQTACGKKCKDAVNKKLDGMVKYIHIIYQEKTD